MSSNPYNNILSGAFTKDDTSPYDSILSDAFEPPKAKSPYDDIITGAAQAYGLDPDLIRATMRQESTFKPKATSNKGAAGLMQLMPETAKTLGVKNIYDPKENIYGGVKYLKQQLDRFGGDVPKALAAYNAGPGAVIKYKGVPPYKETQDYVKRITGNYKGGGYAQSDPYADILSGAFDTPQQPQPPTNPANVMVQPQALPTQTAPQPTQIEGMAPIEAPSAYPQGMPAEQPITPQQAVTPPAQQNAVVAPVNAQNAPVDEEAAKANALMQQQTQAKVANIQKVLKPSAKQGKQYEFQKTGTLTLPPIMGQSAGEVLTYQPDAELEKGGEYKVTDADGNSYTYVPSTGKIAPEAGGAILRDVAVPLGDPNANVNTVKQTQGATIASAIADMLPDVPQQDIVDFFEKKGLSHFDTQQNLTDPEYLKGFVNPVTGTTDAPTTVPYHVTQRGLNQIEAYAKDKADERAKYNDAYKQAVSEGDDPFTASISAKVATNQISAKKGDEIIAAQRPNSPENLRAMAIAAIRQENAPTMGSGKTDAHSNFGEKYEPTEDEIKAKVAELGSPEAIASRERIQQDAANIAANLKSDGLLGQAKLGLQAVGGNLEALAGAALRPFSSVPGLSDLYKTATEKSQARAIAFEHGGDNTWAGFGLRHGVKVAGDLVELALLSKVPGLKGNMPLTFAVQGAATTAGQGGSAVDTTKAFTSGYVLGKIFDGATKAESLVANVGKKAVVTEEVGNNAFLNNIWKGLSQEEKDAQIALMKDTTMSTADKRFLLLNNLVSKMAGGTVIVGGTAGLGKAEGNSNASIADQVATNLLFHFGPSAIQGAVKISSKGYAMVRGKGDVTPDVLDKISGRVVRVWEDGKPHHYFVDNKGQLNKTARPVPQGLVEMETVADPKNPVYKQQTAEGKAKARELPLPDTTQKPIDTKAEDAPLTQRGEDRRKQASSDYADNERRSAERRVKEETLSTISPEQVLNLAGDKKINDATLDATIEKVTGKKSLMDLSKQELLDVSDELRTNPEVSSQSVGEKVQDTKGSDVPIEKGFEMKPVDTKPTLPPLTDNYRKPLSEYAPTLYRETNVAQAIDLLSGDSLDAKPFFSNTPNLAKGQGSNKGVTIELNSEGLQGQVNKKPGWEFTYQNGEAEFVGTHNKSYRDNVKSVTIDKASLPKSRRLYQYLEQSGFEKTKNSDGSITFARPRGAETSANSSLDSSASAEAISENAKRKNEGVESVVKVDTRNGKETPVIGPRPEDTPIKPYETIEFRGGSRNGEILIQGDKIAPNYSPPSRLEGEVVKPKQAESLESPDTHEIKDEGASLKDLEAELKGETPAKKSDVSVDDTVYFEDANDPNVRHPANFRGWDGNDAIIVMKSGMQMRMPQDRIFTNDITSKTHTNEADVSVDNKDVSVPTIEANPEIPQAPIPTTKEGLLNELVGEKPTDYAGLMRWQKHRNSLKSSTKVALTEMVADQRKQDAYFKNLHEKSKVIFDQLRPEITDAGNGWQKKIKDIAESEDVSTPNISGTRDEAIYTLSKYIADKRIRESERSTTPEQQAIIDKEPDAIKAAKEIIKNEVPESSSQGNERTPEARPNSESSGGDKVVTPKPVERPSEELPSEVNAKGVTAEKPIEEGGTDGGKLNEAGVQPKSAETPKELELFKNNKIVTADRVAKIRAEIAKRQGKLTSGIDPVDLALYTELGAAYVEAGARKFADFSKQMIDDLGDEVRPHLDKIYGNVRKHFDFDGMTPDTRTPLEEGKGVAKVGKSIQQKAIEQGLVDEFSDTARYDIKGVEEQAKQVSDLVTSDQPRALRIIRGEEQLPDSINRSMFIDGVERYVKGMDDTVAAGKIISDLMNSDLVTETSKAAQTLRFLQEREPDSVTAYLKQVQDARKEVAKRQGVSSEDVKALDNRINELEKQLAEKQKASIDKQFEQFINEVKSDQTAAKKKGGSVVDYFNELEAKARARIDKRGESAIFRSSVNPIDPQMLADHAIIGAAHIARGVKRGVEFGDAMVKQFGEKIRPYLDDLWDASDRFYKANATKSKADLTPEQIVASSDGVDRNLINSLVSARVKKGDTSVDNVFSEVTKDIQSKYPEVSEREIRDTFTGYGENKEPTRNDLLRQRNVVRRLAKLQSELEDVRNGKAPWKAEHQGQTKSEYVLAKERELEEAMAKAGIPLRAVKSDAERLGMRKKAMQNELRKIERNLSNGNFAKPERRSIPLDPEGAAIQKELTRAREARNNLGYTTSPEEAETLLHLLKAVDEGRTAMAAGGDPKTTYGVAQVALNNYVNDLKLEAKRYKMADFKANPAGFVAHVLNEAASNTKAIAASMDDSAVFRQGWKVMFTNPTIWAKNGIKTFQHLIKMRGQHEVMDALNADIVSRPTYDLMKKAKLDIGVNEETFPTTLPEHIPIFGRVYKATENAYTAFVRKTRADVFDKYIDIANKTGVELTDTELRGIGRMVNSLTGRGDLGTLEQAGKVVNNVFFSPKFLKSHFDVLGGHIITGGGEGSNFVRKQAAINMLKVVGGTAAILAIAKALNPDSVDLDPRSSDFGKIRVGNTTFDVSGGMGSIATLAARMVLSQTKSSVTGKVYQLGETDENGKLKFGTQTRFDVFLNFFTNKFSPLAGAMRDYYKGQTFDNENPTMMRLTEGLLTPLPVKTAQELWQDPNSAPFLEGLLADFMGITTNTYGGSKGVLRDMQKAKVRGDQKEVERLKPILQEELKIEADKLKRKKAENSNK